MRWPVLFLALLLTMCGLKGRAQSMEEDALLGILHHHLDSIYRTFSKSQEVYFLSYRVEKCEQYLLGSSVGSLTQQQHTQQSWLTIQIRVGNTYLDNFSYAGNSSSYLYSKPIALPLDDQGKLVSQILDCEVDKAYQEARFRYYKALVEKERGLLYSPVGDFTLEVPVSYYEPPAEVYTFPEEMLTQRLNTCTRLLTSDPNMDCGAMLSFTMRRSYLVSSEGAMVVQNQAHSHLKLTVTRISKEGLATSLFQTYDTEYPEELPVAENLMQSVLQMEASLASAESLTPAEPTLCPVIFAESAAAGFWHQALVPLVTDYAGTLGLSLLPEEVTIVSDPTQKQFDECRLSGTYIYDDEGNPAQPLTLVDHGLLQNGLYACESSRQGHRSNGHGRAIPGMQPVAQPANLLVSSSNPYSQDELIRMLREELKATGMSYGYWVSDVQPDVEGHWSAPSAQRIYADGRPNDWVYGISFEGSSRNLLSQVVALGNLVHCSEVNIQGAANYHCCSPAVLVRQVESTSLDNRPHKVSLPPFSYNGGEIETADRLAEVVFSVMDEALENAMEGLDSVAPHAAYYVGYLVGDMHVYHVESRCGSTMIAWESPVRNVETQVLLGSNLLNSGRLVQNGLEDSAPFPLDNDYNNMLRALSVSTDRAYKRAKVQMAEKVQVLRLLGDSLTMTRPQDRTAAWVTNKMEVDDGHHGDLSQMQVVANEVSKEMEKYDFLSSKAVYIDAFHGTAYFKATDGVQYANPLSLLRLRLTAELTMPDGHRLVDYEDIYFHDILELQEEGNVYKNVHQNIVSMVERLQDYQQAEWMRDANYAGPVVVTDEGAAQLFIHAFLEAESNLLLSSDPLRLEEVTSMKTHANELWADNVDKRLIHRSLDVNAINTRSEYESISLIGQFEVDADGVKSEDKREIIRHGELVSPLTHRMATGSLGQSNGHLRLAVYDGRVVTEPCAGVLELSGNRHMDEAKMLKALREQSKSAGYSYAYVIRKIVQTPDDCLVYAERVHNGSGKRSPVILSMPWEVTMSDFEQLSAVSKTQKAYNMVVDCGASSVWDAESSLRGVSCSVIVPEMLYFDRLNLLKIKK